MELTKQEQDLRNAYLELFLQRLDKDPKSLSDFEKRLGDKYKETKAAMTKQKKDMEQLQDQIGQAQERLRAMAQDFQITTGRAAGHLESIVEIEMMRRETEAASSDEVAKPASEEPKLAAVDAA